MLQFPGAIELGEAGKDLASAEAALLLQGLGRSRSEKILGRQWGSTADLGSPFTAPTPDPPLPTSSAEHVFQEI